jgi:hypothetical protein
MQSDNDPVLFCPLDLNFSMTIHYMNGVGKRGVDRVGFFPVEFFEFKQEVITPLDLPI